MTKKALSNNNKVKADPSKVKRAKTNKPLAKTISKKSNQITDATKIRALEKKLTQREAEIERLSSENQRLLKETEQRATELQIINNIGQMLTEGIDLQSTLERVGERLREVLKVDSLGIIANDSQTGFAVAHSIFLKGKRIIPNQFSLGKNLFGMQFAARVGGKPLVVNSNVEKNWRRFIADVPEYAETPKSFVIMPLLAGKELVGSITIADYEDKNAFRNLPINLLETIASNMGTAIQNVRLFDETQRLLKETEQRATELQIINNIGQTLTEGLDLQSTLERVGERLSKTLNFEDFGLVAFDAQTETALAYYLVRNSQRADPERFALDKYRLAMRLASRREGKPWVVNTNAEKYWIKFGTVLDDEIAKSFVMFPLLAGRELVGSITIADYKRENAFVDFPISLIETIASNIGTVIQNVRLFEETQRLLKETEQRATELQIINNIGQTLTEGLDLQSTLERVGERLRDTLRVQSIAIAAYDPENNFVLAQYIYHKGQQITSDQFTEEKFKFAIRFAARWAGRSWVATTSEKYLEKYIRKFAILGFPKSFAAFPLLSGGEVIGGITIADDESEDAFTNLPIGMLETISSNIGTAIQNVRLFDETQRLLKETEQRATELQIINNIGQTLTEGLDLQSTLERVGERLRETLDVKAIGIVAFDPQAGLAISNYIYHYGRRIIPQRFSMSNYKFSMRFASKVGSKPWVVNNDIERYWKKFGTDILTEWTEIPKAFVIVPMLAGRELVGSITIADYENKNAFVNLPLNLLETIASNMGTAIQNVRLFDETQSLLKETEQRATELQIINNIGQTLNEGDDLENMIQRVGERIQEALNVNNIAISVFDKETERVISPYMVRNGERIKLTQENFDLRRYKMLMRAWARAGGGSTSWVFNRDIDKFWKKSWLGPVANDVPKSLIVIPFVSGGEIIGGISLADYEKENAFTDISVSMLETIASNMGTAIQNVRLFNETQRLLKETEQRASELQIINNIGQTITGELNLNTLIELVGDKLRETFSLKSIRIAVADINTGLLIAIYMYRNGKRVAFDESWQDKSDRFKSIMRASARGGGRSWVVNTNAEKGWRKFALVIDEEDIPKSFVMLPLLAGGEVVGGIYIPNYEKENAFTDFSIGMLETIASNMGTAIQNIRLFDETKKLFMEAEESRAAAEQANKAKSTFLANMSHELRTPLNAIMGFTSIVRMKADGVLPQKQLDNLDKVTTSSEHLLGLINTVLDIAKIEAGRMDVIPAKFNLSVLADQCANIATPLLKKNVTLEKHIDNSVNIIFSDQDKIKQIVLNLLSNAAKFTHEGSITLGVNKLDEDIVAISVKDSGIGISEEALGRVFDEFQQADSTTTRKYGGTGLGLAISRNLARLLGGDLTATSELGKGATFTLTVPVEYRPGSSSNVEPDSVSSTSSQPEAGTSIP